MNLEIVILSEVGQTKTSIARYCLYVESKKYRKLVNTTNNQTCRERASGYQRREGSREGTNGGRGLRGADYYA